MESDKIHPRRIPTGYAASHCRHCEMGWTRTDKQGGALIVCLLDREPVMADMTSCDRHEPRDSSDEAAA